MLTSLLPHAQGEFFGELPRLPPCSLCGAAGFRPGCLRCDGRKGLLAPLTEAERAARHELASELEAHRVAEAQRLAELAARPVVDVALVGCGKAKRPHASPAAELYTGPLFRLSLRAAREVTDQVLILSARHGLVPLDHVLEPYELALSQLRKVARAAWGARVASSLADRYPLPRVRVTFFAGADYADAVSAWLPSRWSIRTPLEGLSLGARLSALSTRTAAEVHP